MKAFKDIRGQRFGRLVAVERVGVVKKATRWLLRCDCERECVVDLGNLQRQRSCGCIQREQMRALGLARRKNPVCHSPAAV
jgi:hypothetical protein